MESKVCCAKRCVALICFVTIGLSANCSYFGPLTYAEEATCAFDEMTKNYREINAEVQERLEGGISAEAKQIVGEDRINAYATQGRITQISGTTKEATKNITKSFGNQITSLAGLSAQLQELDLLIAELAIAHNQQIAKNKTGQRIRSGIKGKTK